MQRDRVAPSNRFSGNKLKQSKAVLRHALLALAAGSACEMMFAQFAHGATYTWTQSSGTSNWSTPGNWVGGAPASGTSTVIDFFDPANTLGPAGGTTVEGDVDGGLNANPFIINVLNLNGTTTTGAGTASIVIGGSNELEFSGTSAQINMNAVYGVSGAGAGTTYNINDAINFNSNTTLTFASTSSGNLNFNDELDGAGALTVADNTYGSGGADRAVYLNGLSSTASTYTGNVSITAGVLALGKNYNILGTNGLTFNSGTNGYTGTAGTQTVAVSSGASVAFNEVNAAYTEPQNLSLNGTGTGVGGFLGADAALDVDNVNSGDAGIQSLDIPTSATVRVDTNATPTGANLGLQVNGNLAGGGNLTKVGTGALILTKVAATVGSDSAFSGNTNINGGTVQVIGVSDALGFNGLSTSNTGTAGNQTVTIADGASFALNAGNGAYTEPQNFVVNGAGTGSAIAGSLGADAALSVTGINFGSCNILGLAVASNATIRVDEQIGAMGTMGALAPNYGPNWGLYVNGPLAGSGNLTKVGTGLLYLTSTAGTVGAYGAFSGNIIINQGGIITAGYNGFNNMYVNTAAGELGINASGTQTVTVLSPAQTGLTSGGSMIIETQYGGSNNYPQNFVLNGNGSGNIQAYDQSGPPPAAYGVGESMGADAALQVYNTNYGGDFTLGTLNNGTYVSGGGIAVATNSTIRVNSASNSGNYGLLVYGPLAGSGNLTLVGADGDHFAASYAGNSGTSTQFGGFLEFENTAGTVGAYSAFTGNVTVTAGFVLGVGKASNALGSNTSGTQTVTVQNGTEGGSFVLDEGQAAYSEPQNFVINGAGTGDTFALAHLGVDSALQLYNVQFGDSSIGGLAVASNATVRVNTNLAAAPESGLQVTGPLAGMGTLTKIGTTGDEFKPTQYGATVAQDDGILEFDVAAGAVGGYAGFTGNVVISGGVLATGHVSNALGSNSSGTQTVTVNSGTAMLLDEANYGAFANPQNFLLNGTGTGDTAANTPAGSDSALELLEVNFGNATIGGLDIQSSSTIRVNTNGSPSAPNLGLQVNGPLAGSGTLTVIGATGDQIDKGSFTPFTEGYGTLILTQPAGAVGGSGDGGFTGNVVVGAGTANGPVLELGPVSNSLGTNSSTNQTVTVNTGSAVVLAQNSGAYSNPQSFVINGTGTGDTTTGALGGTSALQATGINFSNASIGGLSVASNSTVSVSSTSPYGLVVASGLAGSGNFTLIGGGTLMLNSAAASSSATGLSAYSGNTTVSGATLSVGNAVGSATGSGSVALTGGTLISGTTGEIDGNVSADGTSTIAPGGVGSVGSLTLGGLSTSLGTVLNFDLGTRSGTGLVTSDDLLALGSGTTSIATGTNLSFGGSTVIGDNYRLIGGTISGISTGSFTLPMAPAGQAYALNNSIDSGYIDLVVSAAASGANLTWTDVSANNLWDTNTSSNWNNGTATTVFHAQDKVTFNDSNGGHYSVLVNSTVLPASVTVTNASNTYTISGTGSIGGTGALTKSGAGTLILSTANTYSGGTNVSAGTVLIEPTSSATSALPKGALSISGTGTVQLASNVTAGSQSASPPSTAPKSNVNITSLSITGSGALDIGNNHVIVDYTGSDPISSIAALIASGYAGGTWTGKGITSSNAQSNFKSYGIGYADGADAGNPAGLSSGQIEIAYTLLGDANLDGKVNGTDFTLMATNFNDAVTNGWDKGDFNYSNTVNGSDFLLLAGNFNQFAAQSAIAGDDLTALDSFTLSNGITLASVPEPATIGLLACASGGLLGRRRRRPRQGSAKGSVE